MYFSSLIALAVTPFLQILAASAAPVYLPRDDKVSPSIDSLPPPTISPYYVYFGNRATKELADAFDSLKLRAATVGFLSAPEGKCALTKDLDGQVDDVRAFIALGGAVSISFGGNLGDKSVEARQHVQQACKDPKTLADLIMEAMTKFNTHNIEFDIEDNTLTKDTNAAKVLAQALVLVGKDVPDTFVTYTLGCNPTGMPSQQKSWVQAAKDNGLTIDSLNLMTMNMGGEDNVKDAQSAITAGASQLAAIYGLKSGDAIKKMGMIPAIGVDDTKQVIDLTGITTLFEFATKMQMRIMSYWNFNRDFPGGDPTKAPVAGTSSSPDQKHPSQFLTTLLSDERNDTGGSSSASATSKVKGAVTAAKVATVPSTPLHPSDQQPIQKASLPAPNPEAAPGGSGASA